jgi:integrase
VGNDFSEAKIAAAEVNAQLAAGRRSMFSFEPVTVEELRRRWLQHHEHVLKSSAATLNRYRTASEHLLAFCRLHPTQQADQLDVPALVEYLRTVLVAPNGHPHTKKRRLADKGVKFILGACRSMYAFAGRQRMLPPYEDNPFSAIPIDRMPVEDAKPIHVFTIDEELAFFNACDHWQAPLFYVLAKAGLRCGELTHTLVEDVDLQTGLLHVQNKPDLGWCVKTRNIRCIPLPEPVLHVLRHVIGARKGGLLFPRRRSPISDIPRGQLTEAFAAAVEAETQRLSRPLGRVEVSRQAKAFWHTVGALDTDDLRLQFMGITKLIGLPQVTAPKCWRHTFATLMQEAEVDPVIRQLTMGHVPAGAGRATLGMTATYTHTQREVHRQQLQRVLDLRPQTTELVIAGLASPDKEV